MTISDKIELLRKKQGVSLVHLNNVIGAYRGKITEVRNNKASFDKKEIALLAQALSTSTDYLLGKTDDPTPPEQQKSPPHGGEPLDPVTWELLEIVRTSSEDERKTMLEMVKLLKRGHGDA